MNSGRSDQAGWLQTVLDLLGGLATLVVTWFLFPGVATFVAGTMIEGLVDAVEKRHYPDRAPQRSQSWLSGAASGARFAVIIGDEEAEAGEVTVKPLRVIGEQSRMTLPQAAEYLGG